MSQYYFRFSLKVFFLVVWIEFGDLQDTEFKTFFYYTFLFALNLWYYTSTLEQIQPIVFILK